MQLQVVWKKFFLFVLTILLFSCASSQYYLLPMPENPERESKNYALRYIYIPDYLQRKNIVYFTSGGELNRDAKTMWQADMEDNIKRFFNLQLGGKLYPLPEKFTPSVIADIYIDDLIANAEKKNFTLSAHWNLMSSEGELLKENRLLKTYPLSDFSNKNIVDFHYLALQELGENIRQDLQMLSNSRKK
ncbi:MAG: membrane integrity-associated transporter subunit PqiC [Cardiobacteriaceae bacterium]|nr:membrane integrity-associated transporter subunit PqiC [Cardiobacteriaceae bacterium]